MKIDINRAKDTQGQKLHTKSKLREGIEAAGKGFKQGLILPEFEASEREEKMENARTLLRSLDGKSSAKEINAVVNTVYDLLDDGLANQSRQLPAKTRKRIQKAISAVPFVGYIIYVITTGDFNWQSLMQLVGL